MTTDLAPATIWLVVAVAAVGTFALRLSFIALLGRVESVPPAVEGVLRFVPAAVLAGLVAPAVVAVTADPTVGLAYDPAKVGAAAVAAVVAWRTESVLATIAVGMVALWGLQFLL